MFHEIQPHFISIWIRKVNNLLELEVVGIINDQKGSLWEDFLIILSIIDVECNFTEWSFVYIICENIK